MVFPKLWVKVPFIEKMSLIGNKAVGAGYQQKSYRGDALIGLALGPVFSTCSPTYLFIIATVLPATFIVGLVYLIGFTLGLVLSLMVIAYFGQAIVTKITAHIKTASLVKQVFGVVIIVVGLLILTGADKQIQTFILDSGYGATIKLEERLIEKFAPKEMKYEPFTLEVIKAQDSSAETVNDAMGSVETITLAGGCFWCTEAYFEEEQGVVSAVSGYAGGDAASAIYVSVSKGATGHREAVQITYDTSVLSTENILDIYWSHIDPTNTKGQFADTGFQYTTAIYYHTEEQKMIAEDSKERLQASGVFNEPVATVVLPFSTFFEAEEYHQDYYKKAADHYNRYKKASGRESFVEETWAKDAALQFLESEETVSINSAPQKDDYDYTEEEIAELLKNLDPLAYHVVAESGTESPFNNAYWDNKADGIYVDVVTGKPLFSSTHKYDSGTGWPSFWRTIDDDSVTMHKDNSLSTTRTEIRSDAGHVGHVFDDGPVEEGGRRFCTNSASLRFVSKDDMSKEGYDTYLYLFESPT